MKFTDLTEHHRHLDISLRIGTFYELAREKNLIPQSTSLEEFKKQILLKKPLSNLTSVLNSFALFQKIYDRPEVIERMIGEVIEDCVNEGISRAELRFSPSFMSEHTKLSWEEILDALERGIQETKNRFPRFQAGLILIATRDYGEEGAAKSVEFFLKNRTRLIAMDLAGNEELYPNKTFERTFKPLRDTGVNITIHAGESQGPETVWEAIEYLGAKRIGHGIRAIDDPKLVEHLREKKICLEICPTSNWITRCVPSLKEHPLPKLLRAGVPVSINTDDPGVFAVSLGEEIRNVMCEMKLSEQEVKRCLECSKKFSFLGLSPTPR